MISICVPTYNGAKYLEQTLKSIVNQTFSNVEIVICDDKSSDTTVDIVEEFIKIDSRIRLFKNSKNLGLVGNWNQCIKYSKGSWIKFVFQDDILEYGALEWYYKESQKHKSKFVVSARSTIVEDNADKNIVDFFNNELVKLDDHLDESTFIDKATIISFCLNLLDHNFIGEPSCYFFHKSLINKYGFFDPKLSQLCDYEWALRVGLSEGFTFIPAPLVNFRIHGNAQSSKNQEKDKLDLVSINERIYLLDKYKSNKSFSAISSAPELKNLYSTYLNRLKS